MMNAVRALVTALLITTMTAYAVPQLVNYQGSLASPSGTPLDTTVNMTFTLYAIPNGGAALWTETHPSVSVANGLFQVQLGSITPISDLLFSSGDRWLGTTVGNNTEMTPRQQFSSSATALRVATVDAATGGYISGDLKVYGRASVGHWTNTNEGAAAFVSGQNNHARGDYSVVAGGGNSDPADSNSAGGPWTTIGGGRHNSIAGANGVISGGSNNSVTWSDATVSGGSYNLAGGYGAAVSGGLGNVASNQYATVSGGISDTASNSFATVGGGNSNLASGNSATVGGGAFNKARGDYSVIGGGGNAVQSDSNSATGPWSTIGGGRHNNIAGLLSTISGGNDNSASGTNATVAGGAYNIASASGTAVSGGLDNAASQSYATISGGISNRASGSFSTVSGGNTNVAANNSATVGGGSFCYARGEYSVVSGGGGPGLTDSSSATGYASTIGGGWHNTATNQSATVGGGQANLASGLVATVAGGSAGAATGSAATIGGGHLNAASGDIAVIAGGSSNVASGGSSFVGGGFDNYATGYKSCIPGGHGNLAAGVASLAAGAGARALHDGSFVWGTTEWPDSTASFSPNTFTVRCQGGARFYTTQSGTATGVELPNGGGAWSNLCDVNQKHLYGSVNTSEVLARVSTLPLHRWSYKSQDEKIQHIGPTAQDFYATFGLGDNNTTISTLDPDGVLLAAVQELAKRLEAVEKENARLRTLIDSHASVSAQPVKEN